MATIRKRNNSYEIIVSCGYDLSGKQICKRMTYKPENRMTEKQIEKEVRHQAELFEEKVKSGHCNNSNMRFADFAEIWIKDREQDLRPKTLARYKSMLPRIIAALGHMKLDKIQPPHLRSFYSNLAETGIRQDTKYKCKVDINALIKSKNLTIAECLNLCNISNTTFSSIRKGNNTTFNNAVKISKGFGISIDEMFEAAEKAVTLSEKTVLHHHRLISSIFSTAVEWGILFSNPCDRTKPPKVTHKEPKYLDEEQAAVLLNLLEDESETYQAIIYTLLFTGMRRGELLGLKWSDVDFKNCTLSIGRTVQYLPGKGIFEDETKNMTSNRTIKIPQSAVYKLQQYKLWQNTQHLKMGDRWQNSEYLFTSEEGGTLHPDTLSAWFSKFMKLHSDKLPYITLHSLRHTNATLQIAGGVPITTVAKRLGHANSTTTGKIYAHAIKSADAVAAEALEDLLQQNNRTA